MAKSVGSPSKKSKSSGLAVVVLAAGQGTRMKSSSPKVMHAVAGRPMISHVLAAARALRPEREVVVVAPGMNAVAKLAEPAIAVIQHPARGTGHAVMSAMPPLKGFKGDVLVLYGDTPLISTSTLKAMLKARRAKSDPAVVVLGFRPADPAAYGRLVIGSTGQLERIVEFKDASADERRIGLCNGGAMAMDGKRLGYLLSKLDDRNAKREFYLTDIIGHARKRGWTATVVEGSEDDVLGVNSRAELAGAELKFQQNRRREVMGNGATLVDPDSVWFSADTVIGRDVVIEPHVVFGPKAVVADNVHIRAFSHIEGAEVSSGAIVGPYARLRPGARIGTDAHIGNFVEIKNANVEKGAKINHLTYIGDARVGAGANVGAGTITCNYDGFFKHHTDIGAGAFIGSNTSLVAPVRVGDGAMTGAGSVVTRDVSANALGVERAEFRIAEGFASRFRTQKAAEKAARKK